MMGCDILAPSYAPSMWSDPNYAKNRKCFKPFPFAQKEKKLNGKCNL